MARQDIDILISGGGIAGMIAACAFGGEGYSVLCVDPAPAAAPGDLRTTAFLQPARALLDTAGIWAALAPNAAPLQIMRIIDAGGVDPAPRIIKDFNAADISDAPFGWNLGNQQIRAACEARIAELPDVELRRGVATARLLTRQSEALITLSDSTTLRARFVIPADGRNSPTRDALGIGVKTTRYGQKALAFSVTHPVPHENVSTEIHRSGGPFTLVPLPDVDGVPASSIVWMERAAEAKRLFSLPDLEFETAINERSCQILGPLRLTGGRSIWPMISQLADRITGERTALIAEAAHVVPPIGAQGLNMSLGDLRLLLELSHRHGLGSVEMLSAYQRHRHSELRLRVAGIDALNRASMVGAQGLRDLRAGALDALYALTPLRKTLMKAGLGLR